MFTDRFAPAFLCLYEGEPRMLADVRSSSLQVVLRWSWEAFTKMRSSNDCMASRKSGKLSSDQLSQGQTVAFNSCGKDREAGCQHRHLSEFSLRSPFRTTHPSLLLQSQKPSGLGYGFIWILALVTDRLEFGLEASQRGGDTLRLWVGRRALRHAAGW